MVTSIDAKIMPTKTELAIWIISAAVLVFCAMPQIQVFLSHIVMRIANLPNHLPVIIIMPR